MLHTPVILRPCAIRTIVLLAYVRSVCKLIQSYVQEQRLHEFTSLHRSHLYYSSTAHTAADAEGSKTLLGTLLLHLMKEGYEDTCT